MCFICTQSGGFETDISKILEINKNVVLKDLLNDYKIFSEKIIYNRNDQTFKSLNKTKLNYKNQFIINTKDLSYNKNKNIFNSEQQTTITDNLNPVWNYID